MTKRLAALVGIALLAGIAAGYGARMVSADPPSATEVVLDDSLPVPLVAPPSKVDLAETSIVGDDARVRVGPGALRAIITRGDSMLPMLGEGHMVVIVPVKPEALRVGDYVAYYACGIQLPGAVVIHQVVALAPQGETWWAKTKGINVHQGDECPLQGPEIIGRGVMVVWGD